MKHSACCTPAKRASCVRWVGKKVRKLSEKLNTMAKIFYTDEKGERKEIPINPEKSILEMLEAEGIDYPFSCMAGACSSCKITVHSGKGSVTLDKFGTPLMPVEENEFLSCVCGISQETLSDPKVVIELEKAKEF